MYKFTASCVLAATAAATKLSSQEIVVAEANVDYTATVDLLPDEMISVAME